MAYKLDGARHICASDPGIGRKPDSYAFAWPTGQLVEETRRRFLMHPRHHSYLPMRLSVERGTASTPGPQRSAGHVIPC